jgi:hypothetical protein
MSVDSVNLIFKGVLNRIREANVAEIPALRLNCRIRFRTPLSDKAVKKRRLRRDTDLRARSVELREKEWDIAARVRERALADAREHVNLLMKELATDRAELRARDARIADLASQVEDYRRQLATVIARAIAKNRMLAVKTPRHKIRAKPKQRISLKKPVSSKRTPRRRVKRKTHG